MCLNFHMEVILFFKRKGIIWLNEAGTTVQDHFCPCALCRSSAIHGGDWSTQSKKRQLSELTPQEMPNLLQRVVTKLK